MRALAIAVLIYGVLSAGCGNPGTTAMTTSSGGSDAATAIVSTDGAVIERLDAIDLEVASWRSATDLVEAHAAAEAARNLVVGPAGPGYGDADGDGTVGGASSIGLLPGLAGEPGLVVGGSDAACIASDVLGGSWADAADRWATLQSAIDAWSPSNNTFPTLPSHPQRLVGWATLALATDDLSTALEYGGHAALHSGITRRAMTSCEE